MLHRIATMTVAGALLCACAGEPAGDRCVLSEETGTDHTRVADCEFALQDGTRMRMVLVRHLTAEGRSIDVDVTAFRIRPDGSVERLSDAESSELLAAPVPGD
ncbi:MAG TPA: hypothetical protein VFG21_04725 [Xanthomonadaceae bacterium]|nr:hypothetical protein [Xanthomonadaceae bacterium]